MFERLLIPIYLPSWLYELLVKVKRTLVSSSRVDIGGERNIEWSFLSNEMPNGPGGAIEFGCEQGYMSLVAAQKGFHVLATDLELQQFTWRHPLVEFRKGDFLEMDLPSDHYDLATNCSSVEHVGIAGRYGITVMKPTGTSLR